MNEPPSRWNPEMRPETPAPATVQTHIGAPSRHISEEHLHQSQEPDQAEGLAEEHPLGGEGGTTFPLTRLDHVELNAIVGAGSAFHGTLSFAGQVRIDGELEGVARGGALLVIGHGARVRGTLEAKQVIILGGRVEADIVASHSIELHVPAEVIGELKSPQIYMDRGVHFRGSCDMTGAPPQVESDLEKS
jgi:cytoskeletal protein CcmA (bactofilin family)